MSKTKGSKTGKFGNGVDKGEFEALCSVMCTEREICAYFNVSHDTINRWCHQEYGCTFTEAFEQKCMYGKVSLRRLQYQSAENGNVPMQIFLGKQWLGQSDIVEQTTTSRIEVINDVPKDDED